MTDNQSPASEQSSMEPLTVVVSRRVKKGNQEAFEALSSQMTERASRFPGYLGTAMFRPASPEDPEYRIVFRFRDRACPLLVSYARFRTFWRLTGANPLLLMSKEQARLS